MRLFVLVNSGIEPTAQLEIQELLKTHAKINPNVLEFEIKDKNDLLKYLFHSQSARRIILSLGKYKDIKEINFDKLDFPWTGFFPEQFTFKVDVEGVKGQENRIELAKQVAGKIFPVMEKAGLKPSLELKKPDFLINLFYNGENYFVGLDIAGTELNSRHFRVFAHQASMKGDLAYYFMRKSGFKPKEKLLIGFAKDGTMAIEAALFANSLPVQKDNREFSWKKCPFFKDFDLPLLSQKDEPKTIIPAFDENRTSITAARKNSLLAGTKDLIDFQKYDLDELDTRFNKEEFDRLIFHLTNKDEDKINEIYHQADYVLKPKGTLLLLTSAKIEFSTPTKFVLKGKEEISKGDNVYHLWLMQKK